MEKDVSKTGERGTRTALNDISYNNIPLPSPSLFNYAGDRGLTSYWPSELDMMMMSRSHQSDFLTNWRHHQDLMDRQHAMLSYIEETSKEAQALREENLSLKMVNADLTNRLTTLLKAVSDYDASFGFSGWGSDMDSVLNGLGRLDLVGGISEERGDDVDSDGERPGLMDWNPVEGSENLVVADRVSLPKIISVRSNGYLKTVQICGSSGGKQRVCVPGGEKEKQPLELEVYNQGMSKTELCNKWQESGACPYGENCQFAHGIKELRPIIRHPRYKTEVCRMMLNGDHCPYGHRCHFRHALTDEENLIRSMNRMPLKLLDQ